jgi:hypothetical protein
MERMLYGALNAYHCEHVRVIGKICKTNIASHTAFRGFGMPQVCVPVCLYAPVYVCALLERRYGCWSVCRKLTASELMTRPTLLIVYRAWRQRRPFCCAWRTVPDSLRKLCANGI